MSVPATILAHVFPDDTSSMGTARNTAKNMVNIGIDYPPCLLLPCIIGHVLESIPAHVTEPDKYQQDSQSELNLPPLPIAGCNDEPAQI